MAKVKRTRASHPKDGINLRELAVHDRILIDSLAAKSDLAVQKPRFRNSTAASLARLFLARRRPKDILRKFRKFEATLVTRGLFDLRVERHTWRDTDGDRRQITILRAAATKMWPMGTHFWTRDIALVAARLLIQTGPLSKRYLKLGRELLLSNLTIMSSCAQLRRFEEIIRNTSPKFINDAANWPHIFLSIDENLNAVQQEGWTHKQDAWQMLAWHLLDALESGRISLTELSAKHRRFLGLIVPFLAKVRFYSQENSGSWEEIAAVRSSVIAWDLMLIDRLGRLATERDYDFLNTSFNKHRRHLGKSAARSSLRSFSIQLVRTGAGAAERFLPDESPAYRKGDPRLRSADAALIYLLQLNYPHFLARVLQRPDAWAKTLERKILARILSLRDPRTGGIVRYRRDAYQRKGFFRNLTLHHLSLLFGAPSGNASSVFVGRDRIVPRGPEAAWAHPAWQLSAWAGRQFLRSGELHYRMLHEELFVDGLRMITGTGEYSIEQHSSKALRLVKIPSYRMPECYLTDVASDGTVLIFPTPHTPLNWAVAEALDAFGVARAVLTR